MTTKQKAKRFDEALEIAKKNYVTAQDLSDDSKIGVECFKNTLEGIFPELKESDKDLKESNEAIKNCIGMCLTDVDEQRFIDYNTNLKECLDWLEKQGEQKPTDKIELKKIENESENYKQQVMPEMADLTKDYIRQKHTWSEEDKGNLLDVKCIIDEVWGNQYVREEIGYSAEELESLWHWLDNIWQRVEYPQNS